ncbi:Hvo_1808 family surface protein [Natronorubrum halophilum]|uniref:Hvo_1808 family surface protein n=1 Tax=Natronorubrum halophilum TaxID=1702106 RepID=UPI0010C22787|nr:Hvo_1808 family surface protein [Natronorubrum halophilum]
MQRGRLALFAVVTLVVLSGCTLPDSPDQFDTDRELGYVGDYTHDDVFEFDDDGALTEDQLEAVKYRSMARIEVLRGIKFERDVALEVITRREYRSQRGEPGSASAATNELWRGAFIVDGETDVNRAMDDLYGGAVQGYYTNNRIVIVTDETEEIRIDRETLVHELVHALQDQQFGLSSGGTTIDAQRAELGLIEGEANFIPHLYDRRCGAEWQCLAEYEQPPATSNLREQPFNVGLFLSIYTPYSEGPSFVDRLRERGGWAAVDSAYDDRPASTSQLIHPERYPDDQPVAVSIRDRSSDDWEPYAPDGEARETVGEATLFASLWANGVVERPLTDGGTELSPYNYSHPATDGWAGDTFQVYQDDDDRTGHVWKLAWESDDDAEAFADAYRTLLENRGANAVDDGDGTYRIPDEDPFAGAYRVNVSGDTVTIVGAPTVDELEEIRGTGAEQSESLESPVAPAMGAATSHAGTAPA